MYSCWAAANGTAADLAKELGSGVIAPTTRVTLDPGQTVSYLEAGGVWKWFT